MTDWQTMERCAKCGAYLGQAAVDWIGAATTLRCVCRGCWNAMQRPLPVPPSTERGER